MDLIPAEMLTAVTGAVGVVVGGLVVFGSTVWQSRRTEKRKQLEAEQHRVFALISELQRTEQACDAVLSGAARIEVLEHNRAVLTSLMTEIVVLGPAWAFRSKPDVIRTVYEAALSGETERLWEARTLVYETSHELVVQAARHWKGS